MAAFVSCKWPRRLVFIEFLHSHNFDGVWLVDGPKQMCKDPAMWWILHLISLYIECVITEPVKLTLAGDGIWKGIIGHGSRTAARVMLIIIGLWVNEEGGDGKKEGVCRYQTLALDFCLFRSLFFFSFENLINIYFDPSYGWPSVCDWAPSFELLNQKGNRTAGVEFVKLRDGQIDASPPVDNLNTLGVTNHVVLIWIISTIKNNT